jgi:hypothetical protein
MQRVLCQEAGRGMDGRCKRAPFHFHFFKRSCSAFERQLLGKRGARPRGRAPTCVFHVRSCFHACVPWRPFHSYP